MPAVIHGSRFRVGFLGGAMGDVHAAEDDRDLKAWQPRPTITHGELAWFAATAGVAISTQAWTFFDRMGAPTWDTQPEFWSIDRVAVSGAAAPWAGRISDGLVAGSVLLVGADILIFRRAEAKAPRTREIWSYARVVSSTWVMANLSKIAIRRPRPFVYAEQESGAPSARSSDDWLSFYSLHTAFSASIGGFATYNAFWRKTRRSVYPWVVGCLSVIATSATGIQRVRARMHFPTDVMLGALVGAGTGVLFAHREHKSIAADSPNWSLTPLATRKFRGLTLGARF